jgi:hypothetical protein
VDDPVPDCTADPHAPATNTTIATDEIPTRRTGFIAPP